MIGFEGGTVQQGQAYLQFMKQSAEQSADYTVPVAGAAGLGLGAVAATALSDRGAEAAVQNALKGPKHTEYLQLRQGYDNLIRVGAIQPKSVPGSHWAFAKTNDPDKVRFWKANDPAHLHEFFTEELAKHPSSAAEASRAYWGHMTPRLAGGAALGLGLGLSAAYGARQLQKQSSAHQLYLELQKSAALDLTRRSSQPVRLPYEIEHPYEHLHDGTAAAAGGPALVGAGIGAAIGAGAGLLNRHAIIPAVATGALGGGMLGALVGIGSREAENRASHRAVVQEFEARHGALPYEISHPYQIRDKARLQGRMAGMAADTLISGSPFGIADDRYGRRYGTSTYGLGGSMGAAYGSLSAREQFDRALVDYKRAR